jgi:small-conductance mechanosensitive channel
MGTVLTMQLSGVMLLSSDKLYVGDSVNFGDGTSGKSKLCCFCTVVQFTVLYSKTLDGSIVSSRPQQHGSDNIICPCRFVSRWMETVLRQSDNIVTSVPNSILSGQRLSNLSRQTQRQVKQTLRFRYDDAEKIPALEAHQRQFTLL